MHYYSLMIIFLCQSMTIICTTPNTNCSNEGHCMCELKGAGVIDLSGFKSSIDGNSYVEVFGFYRNEYRYYPCGVDVIDSTWKDCGMSATVCQHSLVHETYLSVGETDQYNIVEAVANGRESYLVIEYSVGSGNEAKLSRVSIHCGETGSADELTFENNISDKEYIFKFVSEKACPVPINGISTAGVAEGAVLLIVVLNVLFIAVVLYLVVGTLYTVLHKGARGLDVIPNWKFWKDVPFLFKDGVLFTFSCIPGAKERIGGVSYSAVK